MTLNQRLRLQCAFCFPDLIFRPIEFQKWVLILTKITRIFRMKLYLFILLLGYPSLHSALLSIDSTIHSISLQAHWPSSLTSFWWRIWKRFQVVGLFWVVNGSIIVIVQDISCGFHEGTVVNLGWGCDTIDRAFLGAFVALKNEGRILEMFR